MGGPSRVYPGAFLPVGLDRVDGPKQPQPVVLYLSLDGGTPPFVPSNLRVPYGNKGALGSDPNVGEHPFFNALG